VLEKLMPRSDDFFDDFDRQARETVEGVRLLKDLLENLTDVANKSQAIKDIEHQGDEVTHAAFNRLHKQFITPFDRAEIHRLLSRIDDVLDLADAASDRIRLYEVTEVPADAKELGTVLYEAVLKMQTGVAGLRTIKKPEAILQACEQIGALEKRGDVAIRAGIAKLFKSGSDPLTVMKWKEILDLLESAIDRVDDVANVLEGVVLEHS
jgi:uncharacterized protein Yka (UPF0111/DUF47 family)